MTSSIAIQVLPKVDSTRLRISCGCDAVSFPALHDASTKFALYGDDPCQETAGYRGQQRCPPHGGGKFPY